MAAEAIETTAATKPEGNGTVVVVDGTRYKMAQEGLARIYVPLSGGDRKERQNGGGGPAIDDHPQQVFYNPIQQFNRDLSVLAIKAYGTDLMERRKEAFLLKKEQFASKKRKRKEERRLNKANELGQSASASASTSASATAAPAQGEVEATGREEQGDNEVIMEDIELFEGERPAKVDKRSEGEDATQAITEHLSRDADSRDGANDAKTAADSESLPQQEQPPHPESAHASTASQAKAQPPDIRILDALSATGLRALRYAHELPFGVSVTANDLLAAATESIRRNVALNGLSDKIEVTQSDALAHMYTVVAKDLTAVAEANAGLGLKNHEKGAPRYKRSDKYDVIDLDPYGTGANFFDAAVQSVRSDGGLLCVTCTDAGVWASQGYPEKCFALYGGVPMKGAQSHEAGLRIVLHALASSASRYGLTITPLLSLSIDFYCRVFVTVNRSPASVKFLAGKTMVAYNCDQGCGAWTTQPLLRTHSHPNKKGSGTFFKYTFATGPTTKPRCEHCSSKTHLAGPMYAGPIHQAEFIQRILDDLPSVDTDIYGTTHRIRGMLQTALEEIVQPEAPRPRGNSNTNGEAKQEAAAVVAAAAAAEPVSLTGDDALAAVDPAPFFFLPTNLAKAMHCNTPGEDPIRGALLLLGYQVTRSHCKPGSIKTNAPWSVLWDVMRAFVRQMAPIKREKIRPSTAAYRLLRIEEEAKEDAEAAAVAKEAGQPVKPRQDTATNALGEKQAIVFDEQLGRQLGRSGEKLVRYQLNPRENWGPMNRAKGH
ncbi:RNA methyltransferase tRNA(m5U54)methyltransferase [Sporothrix curviconia]|uniref:tRNA (guanine(26)-N(2))-dimethyltransferase n=1 Tax=Sporothrix curviconia TaxID=1260050 RepID=A0ABP0CX00_9PEZI